MLTQFPLDHMSSSGRQLFIWRSGRIIPRMDTAELRDALERHREQLLGTVERCKLERDRLQHAMADGVRQGESFEMMRPLHGELTRVTQDYWDANGRIALIDQILEALAEERERFAFDSTKSAVTAVTALGPWASCEAQTCPPFPPWV